MSESLLACPKCKTRGFTKRGLSTHRCDGKNRNPIAAAKSASPSPAGPSTISGPFSPYRQNHVPVVIQDAEMGVQLTEQYHRATGGMREVLKFGAMMIMLEQTLSARGQGTGNGKKGDGVKGWLTEHAPEVNRATAYRFKAVTEAIGEEYGKIVGPKVARQITLPALVTTPAEDLAEPVRAKQTDLFHYVSGTSQRSWLDRFKPAARKGGNTYDRSSASTPPRKVTPQEAAALLQTLCANAGQALATVHKQKAYAALSEAELEGLLDHCEEVAKDVRAWRKLTAAERKAALGEELARQIGAQ